MKKRMTTKIKSGLVLRILRGESIEEVARLEKVTMSDLTFWRDQFLKSGENGLKKNPQKSKELEYQRLIGKLQMENELYKKKVELKFRKN